VGSGKSSFVKAISGNLQFVDKESYEEFSSRAISSTSLIEREKAIIDINLHLI